MDHESPSGESSPASLVAAGYDALGPRYAEWAALSASDDRDQWLDRLARLLRPGDSILDLGCGPGVPSTRWLAERFLVTGVDISQRQLEFAQRNVPTARLVLADMMTLDFPAASFDAVVALYSLLHVPTDRIGDLLARIAAWLRRGGLLLATFGTREGDGVQDDWLGVPMFFSGHRPDGNRALLAAAGFSVIGDEVVSTIEPQEGDVRFHWLLGRVS
jgi:ubiquinone/menaquinone biosynthesis C-methylase UbiE